MEWLVVTTNKKASKGEIHWSIDMSNTKLTRNRHGLYGSKVQMQALDSIGSPKVTEETISIFLPL